MEVIQMKSLLSPAEISDAVINTGIKKVKRTNIQMLLLGVMAGLFIALGAYASNMAVHAMPADNYGMIKFLQGTVFPVGLILVLAAGADLFTGNTLIFLGVLENKVSVKEMLNNWLLVYLGNFIGSIIFSLLIYYSGLFSASNGALGAFHVNIAAAKVSLPVGQLVIRALLANFAVCLAVWMAIGSKTMVGKVFASWFPIMAFVAGGFEHSIANMYYIFTGMLAKSNFASLSSAGTAELANLNWGGFIYNLLFSTAGNIIGGGVFIASMYWLIFKVEAKTAEEKSTETIEKAKSVSSA
jgi:formate/nitrite transporter